MRDHRVVRRPRRPRTARFLDSGGPRSRTPPTLAEPITDAAAYIGVTAASLAAEIVNETMRTGLPGTHVAIEQLDAAMARQLSTLTPGTDANTIFATQAIIATHHAIRNAILSQTVTVLQGALSG